MHRIASDLLVMATAATVIAGCVLAVGACITPASPPLADRLHAGEPVCAEATVTPLQESAIRGHGQVCVDRDGARPALSVSGLTPGQRYIAWVGAGGQVPADLSGSGGVMEASSNDEASPMRRIGEGVAPQTGTLELSATLPDLHLASGAQVTLLLLRTDGRAGPHARVVIAVP